MSSNIKVIRICEFCGSEFTARTITTRYCSHDCNRKAYKANKRQTKIDTVNKEVQEKVNGNTEDLTNREFLKVAQVARLLGCCKKTVYNLISNGSLPAKNIGSKQTIIRRIDIDRLFNAPANNPPVEIQSEIISDWYKLNDVKEIYGISDKALNQQIKKNLIPKKKEGIFTYLSKKHIDNLFNPTNK